MAHKKIYKFLPVTLALVLLLAGCAKDNNPPATQPPIVTGPSTLAPPPGPTPPLPPAPIQPGSQTNCSKDAALINGPVYTFNVTGTGNNPVEVNLPFTSDQLLKVQVEPGSAFKTSGSASAQNYGQLALDVALVSNNTEVGTRSYNGGTDSSGRPNGILVGYRLTKDFSGFLQGNSTYKLRVKNIKSDYTCKTTCSSYSNQTYTSCYAVDAYTCNYWSQWGYYQNGGYCCGPDYTMYNQCAAIQCNVGPVNQSAGWTATVRVETMSTQCLQD